MNVYDFDGTIYDGDSTRDFYIYCLLKHPLLILKAPYHFSGLIGYYLFKKGTKTTAKERFYRFLRSVSYVDKLLGKFWDKNIGKIKQWYYDNQREDDVIISASPEFIVTPACERVGIKTVMASVVDKETGKYQGKNCHGEEKVKRFYNAFPDGKIEEFYSDSMNDLPLARISEKPIFVKKNKLSDWECV